ncbi:pyruvate formate-lyase-activating protein [Nocardioides sp. GY 10127]|uniref:pyruvate formate-lyase-activating protein n=1 Tax=Nocardioides sp. GY 10127 TaxID=2569762 RepID=UPI0010A8295F|nr:pyruvate formate-lyase-activating protein [Nocardioides sp. GY 10127]TIC85525.1 pyruvate formate lyase-activating protein [Nocardioides sp. GY 10127]
MSSLLTCGVVDLGTPRVGGPTGASAAASEPSHAPAHPVPGHPDRADLGMVHSWDVVTGADGPGTRFVTFLAGCPLRCAYCHNPDTWKRRNGTPTTVAELVSRMHSFKRFIAASGGGVTVSGGEPLLQPRFVEAYLRACKDDGMHTALDTSGYLGDRATDSLLDATDLVLLDVKSSDPDTYRDLTSVELAPTLAFGERLAARGLPVRVRFVLVPGVTDDPANVAGVAELAAAWGNVERVDVLGYHRLGVAKYADLGLPYRLEGVEPPTAEQLAAAVEQFTRRGLVAVAS